MIDYYVRNGSSCYVVLLDASKAFDKVNYVKLFKLLRNRGLCPTIIKLLIYMYTKQDLRVKWNNTNSESFRCTNGVKQGGVLSPILFCIYIDELLTRLKTADTGCHIGHLFAGAFGYADDVSLAAPSVKATKSMLKICETFAYEYDVQFNSSKSMMIVFNTTQKVPSISFNGEIIKVVENAQHLGSFIGHNHNVLNIDKACNRIVGDTNVVLSRFGRCTVDVVNNLFNTFCTNFYGSALWNLADKYMERFVISWRKCVKRIWNLPMRTRSSLLAPILGKPDLKDQLLLRFTNFYTGCLSSSNNIISLISKVVVHSKTDVAENIKMVAWKARLNTFHIHECAAGLYGRLNKVCNIECTDEVDVIKELCRVRDGTITCNFNSHDINELLMLICTL